MKLKSVSLENVKRFKKLHVDFVDDVKRKVRNRTVIVGKNGSGKTTLLEAIYSVVSLIGKGKEGLEEVNSEIFSPAGSKLQFEIPLKNAIEKLIVQTGVPIRMNDGDISSKPYDLYIDKRKMPVLILGDESVVLHNFDMYTPGVKQMYLDIQNAQAGIDDEPTIGNLLYFPTDRNTHFTARGRLTNEQPKYVWSYKYDPSHSKWEGSLESYLVWLHYRDLKEKEKNSGAIAKFDQFKSIVNRFLEGKAITTVNDDLRVEVVDKDSKKSFGLESLSSGEKQILLMIGEIYRYITKGSIILIDEPELHLHPVWQQIFVAALTDLVSQFDAQFILTTQSPRIAESVLDYEVVSLDDLLEESQS